MNKVALIILDGWGYGKKDASDAIHCAQTPFFDHLINTYPNTTLKTFGENVGLPAGQMGNSEVGHLNIGAGRVVYQDLVRINKAIETGEIRENKTWLEVVKKAQKEGRRLHLMGLVSGGGVHSHQNHLAALAKLANDEGIQDVFIHAFTDGRDTSPKMGIEYFRKLDKDLENTNAKLATIIGRYFSMDRDLRWGRIKKAYDLLIYGKGTFYHSYEEAFEASYNQNITDEFIEPMVFNQEGVFRSDDVVVCVNFRTDRCRQITRALTQESFPEYDMKPLDIHYYTMTNYDATFKNVGILFRKDNLKNTLGEYLESKGIKQLRIAETEKYPHVTFFFSGGREEPFENEYRIMVNSPKVATYDLQPEMSAQEVVSKTTAFMKEETPEFVCLNFANPDMVGHTGVFDAIVKAVETTDDCLKQVVEGGRGLGYSFVIIADHGNADLAMNEDGSPHTAHTTNPVPIIIVSDEISLVNEGILADVAPTVLKMMGFGQPIEMEGKSLF